jgi:hypothetical protein
MQGPPPRSDQWARTRDDTVAFPGLASPATVSVCTSTANVAGQYRCFGAIPTGTISNSLGPWMSWLRSVRANVTLQWPLRTGRASGRLEASLSAGNRQNVDQGDRLGRCAARLPKLSTSLRR